MKRLLSMIEDVTVIALAIVVAVTVLIGIYRYSAAVREWIGPVLHAVP